MNVVTHAQVMYQEFNDFLLNILCDEQLQFVPQNPPQKAQPPPSDRDPRAVHRERRRARSSGA